MKMRFSCNVFANCFAEYPASGFRHYGNGMLSAVGNNEYIWSSTIASTDIYHFYFSDSRIILQNNNHRAYGVPVRCLQE